MTDERTVSQLRAARIETLDVLTADLGATIAYLQRRKAGYERERAQHAALQNREGERLFLQRSLADTAGR